MSCLPSTGWLENAQGQYDQKLIEMGYAQKALITARESHVHNIRYAQKMLSDFKLFLQSEFSTQDHREFLRKQSNIAKVQFIYDRTVVFSNKVVGDQLTSSREFNKERTIEKIKQLQDELIEERKRVESLSTF